MAGCGVEEGGVRGVGGGEGGVAVGVLGGVVVGGGLVCWWVLNYGQVECPDAQNSKTPSTVVFKIIILKSTIIGVFLWPIFRANFFVPKIFKGISYLIEGDFNFLVNFLFFVNRSD